MNKNINNEFEQIYQQSVWTEKLTINIEQKYQQSIWREVWTISLNGNVNSEKKYEQAIWTKILLFNLNKAMNNQFDQKCQFAQKHRQFFEQNYQQIFWKNKM